MKEKNAFLLLNRAEKLSLLLYILLAFLLPTQLGKHFWPEYSLISGFRVDYLSPTLYLTDILLIVLFFTQLRRAISPFALKPYLLAFLFLFLTILPAYSFSAGMYSLLKIGEMVFFAWFVARHLKYPLYRFVTGWAFLLAVIYESLIALTQTLMKGYLGGVFYYLGERAITSTTPGAATAVVADEILLRAYGTFSHPNVLGGFLVIYMTYLLLKRNSFSTVTAQVVFWVGIGLGTLGLGVTLSRIPIVLWVIILIGFLLKEIRSRLPRALPHQLLLGGGVLLLFLYLLSPLSSAVRERFLATRLLEESVVVRADLNETAITIIREHPVLGVGLGNLLFTSVTYKAFADPLYFAVQPVHNILLYITAETGLLGLFLFLWVLVLAFSNTGRSGRVLLGLVFVLGMFDHYFLTIQQGQLLFAFVIGYCFVSSQGSAKTTTRL